MWIDVEGDYIVFNTAVGRVKEENLRRDPLVSLSCVDTDSRYDRVVIRGRVVEGAEAERCMDQLAKKYVGTDRFEWRIPGEAARQGSCRADTRSSRCRSRAFPAWNSAVVLRREALTQPSTPQQRPHMPRVARPDACRFGRDGTWCCPPGEIAWSCSVRLSCHRLR
jgi:hypothetical protein